jgi:serine protease Do
VNISVTARAQRTSAQVPQGVDPDDPLFQFFKRFGPQFQGRRMRSRNWCVD